MEQTIQSVRNRITQCLACDNADMVTPMEHTDINDVLTEFDIERLSCKKLNNRRHLNDVLLGLRDCPCHLY